MIHIIQILLILPILQVKAYLKDSCMEQDSAHMATIVQLLLIPKLPCLPQKLCFSQSPLANVFQLKMSVKHSTKPEALPPFSLRICSGTAPLKSSRDTTTPDKSFTV